MSNVKIKLSYKGIGALLRGREMYKLVEARGEEAAVRAGEGFKSRVHNTGQRWAANVFPETFFAEKKNLKQNTLLKSVK